MAIKTFKIGLSNSDKATMKSEISSETISALIDEFSTSSTYAVGDYVSYNGVIYRCITAITTAGAWDSSKWEEASLNDVIDDVNEAVANPLYMLSQFLTGDEVFSGQESSQHYMNMTLDKTLQLGCYYLIGITIGTEGTYTIKTASKTSDGLVSTIFDNQHFNEGETKWFIGYTPVQADERYLYNSNQQVDWSAKIYKLEKNYEYIKDIYKILNDVLIDKDYSDKTAVELDVETDGYYNANSGAFVSDTGRCYAIVSNVEEGATYALSTHLRAPAIAAIMFFYNNTYIKCDQKGTGSNVSLTDYIFVIPKGCNKIIVQSTDTTNPSLSLVDVVDKAKFYTKAESDARYIQSQSTANLPYGIRWSLTDNDDLGERVLGADGLVVSTGVGSTDGSSPFDSIYPWSEIKRCNIKQNANGAYVVTYEGEAGFALDGSNGDVFVRIPKFNVLRYKKDGYEYRIIGAPNSPVHEAFIEDGKELDEIFVGAFEGFVSGGSMYSKGGVIPTNNMTPQQFLNAAKERGSKYSLYDNRCVDAIWTLLAIELGKRNTNAVLGYGAADFLQPVDNANFRSVENNANTNYIKVPLLSDGYKTFIPVGSNITICNGDQTVIIAQRKIVSIVDEGGTYTKITFDGDPISISTTCFFGSAPLNTNFCEDAPSGALSWHTGRANWISGSNTKNPIRYRWIENIFGNVWHYLPDVSFKNLQMYVCPNMKDYEFFNYDTSKYKPIGSLFTEQGDNGSKSDVANENYWITSLADETFAKSVLFGRSYDKSLLSTKAFGAYYYLGDGEETIANGGGFDHLYRCNILTQRAWIGDTTKWYLYGARLMFKNI